MASFRHIASWLGGRRQVIVLVLIGWIALVVMSAGSKTSSDELFRLPDLRGVIVGVTLIVALCGLIILPFLFRSQDGPLERPPAKSTFAILLMTVVIIVFVMALDPDLTFEPQIAEEEAVSTTQQEPAQPGEELPAELGSLTLLVLACVGTGAVLLWTRYQLGEPEDSPLADEDDFGAQVDGAISTATDLLSSGADPRESVLAAYASLERALADQDRPRRPSETATEHLKRVLHSFPSVAGPAVRLGQLYELARFSENPITAVDQHEAADALRRSRSELSGQPSSTQ